MSVSLRYTLSDLDVYVRKHNDCLDAELFGAMSSSGDATTIYDAKRR